MVDSLLLIQSTDEQQTLAIARLTRLEQLSRDWHRRDHGPNSRHHRLRFFLQPTGNCRHCRRVLENVREKRLRHSHRAGESNVSAVKRGNQRHVRQAPDPGSHNAAWKPPVRVDNIWLETAPRADGVYEVGAEEADER